MTVSTTDSEVEYVSGGPSFPIPYRFLDNADIEANLLKQDGTSETLVLGTQYTVVSEEGGSGGTLTSGYAAGFLATPGASLSISRVMDPVQLTDLRNQGRYLAETQENVFDRLTMLIQQFLSNINRALKRPINRNYYDAEGRVISNLADPVSPQDAVTKNWVGSYIDSVSGLINTTIGIAYDAGTLFDYLRFGVARQVDTIAALRSLAGTRNQRAYVHGYYAKGDGGGGEYFLDSADVTSPDNGGTIIVASDGARWKLSSATTITTRQFGARANGVNDDYAAVMAWFTYGINNRCRMVVSKGLHAISSAMVWNFNPCATVGCHIVGEGSLIDCGFDFTGVPAASGTPFQMVGNASQALFYLRISGFRITTNFNGVGMRIGLDTLTDAFNECAIDLWVNNNSQGASAETLRANHILHSDLKLVCNGGGSGRPGQPLSPGYGTAIVIRQLIMNRIMLAVGNANKGIYITGTGFTYANNFDAIDMEEVNYGLLIDAVNCSKNTWIGGQWLALNLFNCTAGSANKIVNPNLNVYSGGTQNVSLTGLEIDQPYAYGIATPAFPAASVYVKNNTGRKVIVSVVVASGPATMTSCDILRNDGFTEGQPVGGSWAGTMDKILMPNDSIRFNGYTGTLGWLWRPV